MSLRFCQSIIFGFIAAVLSAYSDAAADTPSGTKDPPIPESLVRELGNDVGIEFDDIRYVFGEVEPNPNLEAAIVGQLEGYVNCEEDPAKGLRYLYNFVDLDGDETFEAMVYLVGAYACGSGGCTLLIFRSSGELYEPIGRIVLVNNPIVVSDQMTNGWRDLILYVTGGGADGGYRVLKHSGRTYPENPSVEPALDAGSIVTGDAYLANEISFDTEAPVLRSNECGSGTTEVVRSESLGGLRIDQDEKQVLAMLGEPDTKGERGMAESDALYYQSWRYQDRDIVLEMVSESVHDEQKISSIRAGLSSLAKTRVGIGIGDSYLKVERTYGADRNKQDSIPSSTLVVGSMYEGLVFSFENGKVTQILLGVAAE